MLAWRSGCRFRLRRTVRGTLRAVSGQDAEPAAAVDPIRIEIRVIHGEDSRQRLTFCKLHQSGVREVHGARDFGVFDRAELQRAGTNEFQAASTSSRLSPTR
jgi:hypothetical protein